MRSLNIPRSLTEVLAPERTALIVWDMQVGIAGRALNLSSLRPAVDSLLQAARAAGVFVVWSRHIPPAVVHDGPPSLRAAMRQQGVTEPAALQPRMRPGSPEAEFLPGLVPEGDELVLEKSTPSFFIGTPLEVRLRARDIRTIVLAGVATEHGIEFTARHALALGLFVVVAEDAVGSFTAAGHDLGLTYLRIVADVVPAAEVSSAWTR